MLELVDGLRATKKRRTFEEILANGVALFRAQGLRRTRTEEIARASSVSAATLFNYFPSKAALAEAWVRGECERLLAEALSDGEGRGLRTALRAASRGIARQLADAPALRLEAWRAAGRARAAEPGPGHPLVVAVEREQAADRLRRDLPASLLATALLDALEAGLIDGLRGEPAEDVLARGLQARVDLVLDGARKRNERVELPRAGAGRGGSDAGGGAGGAGG
jgi:AcrR family transcriptional regulator